MRKDGRLICLNVCLHDFSSIFYAAKIQIFYRKILQWFGGVL